MSSDLQWLLVRKSSCFILKRKKGGIPTVFSTEPNNVMNRNSFKYCSLVNKKVVGVSAGAENKGVVLTTKRLKGARKPATMFVKHTLNKDRRRSFKYIRKHLGSTDYRQDLLELAVRRANAIFASQKPKRLSKKRRR